MRGYSINVRRLGSLALVLVLPALLATGATSAPSGSKLVADAGDSAYLRAGDGHALGGMAWGGVAPYRYRWSHKGSASRFTRAEGANTIFKTEGLNGDQTVELTVTDAAGSTVRDTVKLRVYSTAPKTILTKTGHLDYGLPDENVFDPGAESPDGQSQEIAFAVPSGVTALDLSLSWTTHVADPVISFVNAYDLDLYVRGPNGEYTDITSGATGVMPERIHIEAPKPGTYTAIVSAYLNGPEDYTLTASVTPAPPANPIPQIDVPATFRFAEGAAQTLKAAVKGGGLGAWDLDFDGAYETRGASARGAFVRGKHLATFKAVRNGFEARRTVAVSVVSADEIGANTTPFVVIGVGDSGINAYHEEFSAETYPDPEILRITENFTKHPSQYIPGYPKDVPAIPITLGKGYLPAEDSTLWTRERIQFQKQYWFPGTKIIGAIDWTDSSGVNAAPDSHPILDDDGHGTESSSVSAGNRFGNCQACLLVFAEGLSGDDWLEALPYVDIMSMSVGSVGNVGFPVLPPSDNNKLAAERGMTELYAAGNGFGNAFDVPMLTYTSTNAGPDWHVVVGAARTDNRRPIFGDAIPVDISSWGDGSIPSACMSGTVSMCNFGGTSAATPLTAGVFGQTLREVRRAIGDTSVGPRNGVVARGTSVPASDYLRDGVFTRAELWDVMFHTAEPFGPEGPPVPPFPYTWQGPASTDYLAGGYGLATPESGEHALDVALGRKPIPERTAEDSFFAQDAEIRNAMWGEWSSGEAAAAQSSPFDMLPAIQPGGIQTRDDLLTALNASGSLQAAAAAATAPITFWFHHAGGCPTFAAPAGGVTVPADAPSGYTYMSRANTSGDNEPCPNARATTVAGYFRPVGIWSSGEAVGTYLPAGTNVDATVYLTMAHPMLLEATGYLLAGNREVGRGASAPTPVADVAAARCRATPDSCWTEVPIHFTTSRPVGPHEVLTYEVSLRTSEDTYFGYEGNHASKVSIAPAAGSGVDLLATITSPATSSQIKAGKLTVTGSARFGDQAVESLRKVELSVDDPGFADPIAATTSGDYTSWSARVPVSAGQHTIYARAVQDRRASQPDSVRVFTAGAAVLGARQRNLPATGVSDDVLLAFVLLAIAAAGALALRSRRA